MGRSGAIDMIGAGMPVLEHEASFVEGEGVFGQNGHGLGVGLGLLLGEFHWSVLLGAGDLPAPAAATPQRPAQRPSCSERVSASPRSALRRATGVTHWKGQARLH